MMQQPGGSKPSASIIIAIVLIAILAVVTVVGAVTVFQLPSPITEQGNRIHNLFQAVLAISFLVFFAVTAGIIWALFRYRRRDDSMPVQIHGSSTLEFTWTIIPILILVGLFVPSLILVIDLKTQPAEADADVVIEVIGHQWWWEFNYEDEKSGLRIQATPPDYNNLEPPHLVVPEGKTVLLRIRSTDVVHSFSAPHLLYKVQAIPGTINEMHFNAKETGTFLGQCYQFCGLRHADMLWVLDVRSESDYQAWLSSGGK
jgi:cytochrome c oxidase subunit 2